MSVVQFRKQPVRAIVIRFCKSDRFVFTVAPVERCSPSKPATFMGHHSFGANDIEGAWAIAWRLSGQLGLPIVNLTEQAPAKVALGGAE